MPSFRWKVIVRASSETSATSGCDAAPAAGGVDFRALTAYAGDDAEAARSILRSFAEQTAAHCAEMERALDRGDDATVRALAHKMVPIFTMLRAAEVAETLRRAETDDRPGIASRDGALRAAVGEIRAIVAEAEKRLSL